MSCRLWVNSVIVIFALSKILGYKISLVLASHWVFGVDFIGVLFTVVLESTIEHLKRRIMKKEIKTGIKKILGGVLSKSSLIGVPPRR